jgi:hypothetical protein
MVLLQHKLNVKLSQRQILTPGLVQMVSVLALNKLELKDMINAEMVENPVLEELEDAIPMLDDVGRQEEERDRLAAKATTRKRVRPSRMRRRIPSRRSILARSSRTIWIPVIAARGKWKRSRSPRSRTFLSKPGNLSDHLLWQLGAISVRPPVHQAAELDHWESERRRISDCQRRGTAGNRSGRSSRGRCGSGGQDRWVKRRRWGLPSRRLRAKPLTSKRFPPRHF